MIPVALQNKIEDTKIYPSREKVCGRMWGGSAKIVLGENTIHLELWHHGGDNETSESLIPYFRVRSVNGYDAYWHCLISDDAIWLHTIGWFGNSDLEKEITGGNPNFRSRTLKNNNYNELGFIHIW